jgi:hypothetical protein
MAVWHRATARTNNQLWAIGDEVNCILIAAVIAVGAMTVVSDIAVPQTASGATSWTSSGDCVVAFFDIDPNGTAEVTNEVGESDTAHWTVNGTELRVRFDSWVGGMEITVADSQTMHATLHWADASGAHISTCTLKKTK